MGLDQLTPAGTAFVTMLQTRLRESPYAGPVLNDATKVLLRYELLEEPYRRGLNRHRAVRASSDFSSLRFPVFVREEFRHNGAIIPLIQTRSELEAALGRVLLRGFRLDELPVVEFCDTRDSQGRYRKYTAYVVRAEVMPRSLEVGSGWMLKHGAADFNEQTLLAEREYARRSVRSAAAGDFRAGRHRVPPDDYAIKDGTIETWEINTNPTVGPGSRTSCPARCSRCASRRATIQPPFSGRHRSAGRCAGRRHNRRSARRAQAGHRVGSRAEEAGPAPGVAEAARSAAGAIRGGCPDAGSLGGPGSAPTTMTWGPRRLPEPLREPVADHPYHVGPHHHWRRELGIV